MSRDPHHHAGIACFGCRDNQVLLAGWSGLYAHSTSLLLGQRRSYKLFVDPARQHYGQHHIAQPDPLLLAKLVLQPGSKAPKLGTLCFVSQVALTSACLHAEPSNRLTLGA